jgi:hypothetical protein
MVGVGLCVWVVLRIQGGRSQRAEICARHRRQVVHLEAGLMRRHSGRDKWGEGLCGGQLQSLLLLHLPTSSLRIWNRWSNMACCASICCR